MKKIRKYQRVSAEERGEMRAYKRLGKSISFIAQKMGKDPKTIRFHLSADTRVRRSRSVVRSVAVRRKIIASLVQETKETRISWKVYEGQRREATRLKIFIEPAFPNARAISDELFNSFGIAASPWTVHHDLVLSGYRMVRRKSVVSMDPSLWQQRLAWAVLTKPKLQRLRLAFADECAFSLAEDASITMHYRRSGDSALPRLSSRASGVHEKVHIWVCFGPEGFKKLVMFDSTVNSETYCFECIEKVKDVLRQKKLTLIHDNAQAHKSFETSLYLVENEVKILEIPPHSPDLNMAERVFSFLKPKVSLRHPTHLNFKKIIVEEFNKIPQSVFDSFLGGIYNAVEVCIRRQGKFHD